MVCEVPRQRQLFVSRRGSFFEDPFFRDAWDDYSHAVRRIVDRFNHGWVNPSQRLHDSQYHSLYRTLRTARLNYSTYSARFKEEGNVYELVMDVREFIGGDITVRTAGGTVSVRGKVEVGAEERAKKEMKDDDNESSISGRSSSAKTLHRRFTLPADANCEEVESSLSRDAVLTVTIPKRTDIHYIPVNVEGEGNKENEEAHMGTKVGFEGVRQPGVKRPSDTPLESTRKKSQEEASNGRRRRRRHRKEEEKKKEDKKGDRKEERHSRRRSKDYGGEEYFTKFRDAVRDTKKHDEFEGKRRKRDEEREGDRKQSHDRRSRRRESKYEDVHEINIPVRINKSDPSEKAFRPFSLHEPRIRNIEIEQEAATSSGDNQEKSSCFMEQGNRRRSEGKLKTETKSDKGHMRRRSYPERKLDEADKLSLQLNLNAERPNNRKLNPLPEIKETESKSKKHKLKEDLRDKKESDAEFKSLNKGLRREREFSPKNKLRNEEVSRTNEKSTDRPISVRSIDVIVNEDKKDTQELEETGKKNLNKEKIINNTRQENHMDKEEDREKSEIKGEEEELNGILEPPKNRLETPRTSLFRRPSSPISPGSRLVKVEENQSFMEEGIFKDCWNDFSNTLQDVLSRLQELSSELGQSKILATTPSAEPSPPVDKEGSSSLPFAHASATPSSGAISTAPSDLPRDVPSPINEGISAHSGISNVGGVGGREGGTKDENSSAHSPWRAGHGRSEAYDLDAKRKPNALKGEITQTALKNSEHLPTTCSDTPSEKNSVEVLRDVCKTDRPVSLSLRNVASPQKSPFSQELHGESASLVSRPNSLCVNDASSGSLLESLRKNSPVEALQEDFFRRTKPSLTSENKGHFVPVEVDAQRAVPVGGLRKEEERSVSLSPSDSQSNVEPDWSESGSSVSDALGNPTEKKEEDHREGDGLNDVCDSHGRNSANEGPSSLNDKKELSTLNDLSSAHKHLQEKPTENAPRKSLNFAPNIDASPESNVTDESESSSPHDGVVHGRFTFPVSSDLIGEGNPEVIPQKERESGKTSSFDSDVPPPSDVTASIVVANEKRPEIPSDDVMGCERPLVPSATVSFEGAKEESLRFSRINRPRDLLLQEARGDADSGREANGVMGGVFSRGRNASSRACSESLPDTPSTGSPSAYPPSPSSRKARQQPLSEEKVVPSYVRLHSDPPKRYSGFAHVSSDNVRRMRNVWGAKQEPKSQTPPRPLKVPPRPTRTSSRSSSDVQGCYVPRAHECDSPRPHSVPSSEVNRSATFRKSSPSPSRGTPSPSYTKSSSERFFKEKSPSRTNASSPSKPSPPYNSSRRSNQGSQGRASPAPSSPGRRCSRDAKESPSPSPSVERRLKNDYGRRSSYNKSRTTPPSKPPTASPVEKEPPCRRSPPVEEPPRASKVHQKIFKRLRDASLQPDSEAICFKEEKDKYKMVLDVEEYVPGEIEVLQDDRILTVKGRVETKNAAGHRSVKTFDRTFDIPKNSREEDIDSALSKDGILTIFVPKKKERIIKIELVD